MIESLEIAIEKIKALPPERQSYAALLLEQVAAEGAEPFTIPEAHRSAVLEGLAQAERGEFVSDEEMAALWVKCGL